MSGETERRDPLLLAIPRQMGAASLNVGEQVGGLAILLGQIVARLFPPRVDRYELIRNLHKMGVRSLPIVVVTALFVGAIMVIQAAPLVTRIEGSRSMIGWGAGFATLREVGPLLIALMFSGRVGANNA